MCAAQWWSVVSCVDAASGSGREGGVGGGCTYVFGAAPRRAPGLDTRVRIPPPPRSEESLSHLGDEGTCVSLEQIAGPLRGAFRCGAGIVFELLVIAGVGAAVSLACGLGRL